MSDAQRFRDFTALVDKERLREAQGRPVRFLPGTQRLSTPEDEQKFLDEFAPSLDEKELGLDVVNASTGLPPHLREFSETVLATHAASPSSAAAATSSSLPVWLQVTLYLLLAGGLLTLAYFVYRRCTLFYHGRHPERWLWPCVVQREKQSLQTKAVYEGSSEPELELDETLEYSTQKEDESDVFAEPDDALWPWVTFQPELMIERKLEADAKPQYPTRLPVGDQLLRQLETKLPSSAGRQELFQAYQQQLSDAPLERPVSHFQYLNQDFVSSGQDVRVHVPSLDVVVPWRFRHDSPAKLLSCLGSLLQYSGPLSSAKQSQDYPHHTTSLFRRLVVLVEGGASGMEAEWQQRVSRLAGGDRITFCRLETLYQQAWELQEPNAEDLSDQAQLPPPETLRQPLTLPLCSSLLYALQPALSLWFLFLPRLLTLRAPLEPDHLFVSVRQPRVHQAATYLHPRWLSWTGGSLAEYAYTLRKMQACDTPDRRCGLLANYGPVVVHQEHFEQCVKEAWSTLCSEFQRLTDGAQPLLSRERWHFLAYHYPHWSVQQGVAHLSRDYAWSAKGPKATSLLG